MRAFTPLKVPFNIINLQTVIRELSRDLLKYVTFSATIDGDTVIDHLLGRQPMGWIVIDKTSSVDISRTAWDKNTITLTSTSSVDCKILIF